MDAPDLSAVADWLADLQERIAGALTAVEGTSPAAARFDARELAHGNSRARPRVLENGAVLERAAVQWTHTRGARLPAAASARRPELAGALFEAASLSLIVHPRNPHAPTCHANLRCFHAQPSDGEACWWFGGGLDLTPVYGYEEDARHWHRTCADALQAFDAALYARFKRNCDEYFRLPHRGEARGVGGLFFDDWSEGGFARSFELARAVGEAILPAYLPILERRKDAPHGAREREFQLYRRGRYVEFNLICDRGTLFGLQSGGRAESILASLPPAAHWRYDWRAEAGTREAELVERYLQPRDWL
jgi:coproporphyrinogen III oxidase